MAALEEELQAEDGVDDGRLDGAAQTVQGGVRGRARVITMSGRIKGWAGHQIHRGDLHVDRRARDIGVLPRPRLCCGVVRAQLRVRQ